MEEKKEYRDVRVFRFTANVLVPEKGVEVRCNNPVPVYTDDHRLIGFATVTPQQKWVAAEFAIDPGTPERFDLETKSKPYWIDSLIEARGLASSHTGRAPTILYVKALFLTTEPIEGTKPLSESDQMVYALQ